MKFREIPLIVLGYGSRLRTTGGYRVRSLPGVARPSRGARRWLADQARGARLGRPYGADRSARSRRQQRGADGARMAGPIIEENSLAAQIAALRAALGA